MTRIPEIIPVSELRQDTASVLGRLRASHSPIVITQRGKAAAVLVSIDSYERDQRERELLRALTRGEAEIKAGDVYDLDEVMGAADALLDSL